jgi:hypothetical protein
MAVFYFHNRESTNGGIHCFSIFGRHFLAICPIAISILLTFGFCPKNLENLEDIQQTNQSMEEKFSLLFQIESPFLDVLCNLKIISRMYFLFLIGLYLDVKVLLYNWQLCEGPLLSG